MAMGFRKMAELIGQTVANSPDGDYFGDNFDTEEEGVYCLVHDIMKTARYTPKSCRTVADLAVEHYQKQAAYNAAVKGLK